MCLLRAASNMKKGLKKTTCSSENVFEETNADFLTYLCLSDHFWQNFQPISILVYLRFYKTSSDHYYKEFLKIYDENT